MLDIRTVALVGVMSEVVCALVVTLLWRYNRGRFDGLGLLAADFALQAAGLLLIVLRGAIPDWMSMVTANTLVVTGAILGYAGLGRFVGKKTPQIIN
ncbi:MAG: hypothetical protein WC708_14265, partial [Lentisphaeria bacterium]